MNINLSCKSFGADAILIILKGIGQQRAAGYQNASKSSWPGCNC